MKRLAVVGLLFLTACAGADGEDTTTSTPDPGTTETTGSFGRAEVEAAIAEIGLIDSLDQTRQVVEMVGLVNEPDLLPYVFEAGRFGDADTLQNALRIGSRVTGEIWAGADAGDQWRLFGNWIMDNGPDPGPEFIAWKAALYGNIDEAFEEMIGAVEDPVTATRLQWGGVRRGGIPELNDAMTISVEEAAYMQDDEIVFGAVINDSARAYPVRILGHHELANDTLGGAEVALAYCTLCRTPVLYSAEVAGMTLDFQTSGLLENSNKIMVDNQTNSLWNELTGEAFAGPLAGEVLTRLPMTVTTWADWIAEHPDTDVQTVLKLIDPDPPTELVPTGGYSYEPGQQYAAYYASSEVWFPVFDAPDVFAEKDEVVTLDYAGEQLAVRLFDLLDAGGLVTTVGGEPVVFVASGNGARVYEGRDGLAVVDGAVVFNDEPVTVTESALVLSDGTELERIVSGQSFWFAWYGNFPDTAWWPEA